MREVIPFERRRPPQRVTEEEAINKAERRVKRKLKFNLTKLEELAAGIYLVDPKARVGKQLILRDEDTGDEVILSPNIALYRTPPDLKALQYLADRAMGKIPQRHEITGDKGGPVEITPWRPMTNQEYLEVEAVELPELPSGGD